MKKNTAARIFSGCVVIATTSYFAGMPTWVIALAISTGLMVIFLELVEEPLE